MTHGLVTKIKHIYLYSPCQISVHVPVMFRLESGAGALFNQLDIILRHPLGYGCLFAWGRRAYIAPSSLGTWCPRGSLVLSGVGSWGRRSFLSSSPHEIWSVSAVSVFVIQSDMIQNSSDNLSPQSKTDGGLTQGCHCSTNEKICPVGPATTSSCGRSVSTALNDSECQLGQRNPGSLPPVGSTGYEGVRYPCSSHLWKWKPFPVIDSMPTQYPEGDQ